MPVRPDLPASGDTPPAGRGPLSVDAQGVLRAAVLQLNSGEDVAANLATALELIDAAVARGARLLVLPEKFHYLGDRAGVAMVKTDLKGGILGRVGEAARRHGVYVVAGSVWERVPGEDRTFNTSVLIGPDGGQVAAYRKMHMFDVEVGGTVYRESDDCRPGEEVVAVRLPATGPGGSVVLGMSICYDLRFPELYRALADMGAGVVSVPAAFTMATGRDHWSVLVRARAIENQVFVLAADQCGSHGQGLESYGRSMIVDPWGVVLAQVPDGPGVAVADLDLARLAQVRATLPSPCHRAAAGYQRRRLVDASPSARGDYGGGSAGYPHE